MSLWAWENLDLSRIVVPASFLLWQIYVKTIYPVIDTGVPKQKFFACVRVERRIKTVDILQVGRCRPSFFAVINSCGNFMFG